MSTPSPAEPKETMLVRKTFFDLDAFDDAYLGKYVVKPAIHSMADALHACGGDQKALLEVVQTGLVERAREHAKSNAEGWFYMDENNQNELTDKPFTGTPASSKGVRQTIMTLARTVFGYISGRNVSDEQKKKNETAKQKAENMVKTVDDIREGLKAAALESED